MLYQSVLVPLGGGGGLGLGLQVCLGRWFVSIGIHMDASIQGFSEQNIAT